MMAKKQTQAPKLSSTAQLAPDSRNPRTISPTAAAGLSVSLDEFGDLSGIVFNARTEALIGAHQRLDQIRKLWGDQPIQGLQPAANGDQYGYIDTPKGRFAVRVVDWPIEKQRAANIAANNPEIAGIFTNDLDALLLEVKAETPGLFDDLLFAGLLGQQPVNKETELKQIDVKPPPKMAWVLVGIPTVRYGEIAADMERIGAIEGVICETTANDG